MNAQPQRSAIITGITGQDGSYLCELLLRRGYQVHGLVRRTSTTVRHRLDHLTSDPSIYNTRMFLHYADLDDATTLRRILMRVQPDEVYHLAGQSHVGVSFDIPESTCEFTAMGTLRLLEILRDMSPIPKLLHASSSEVFGHPDASPQNEGTPFRAVNPYGVAKSFASDLVRVYRETYGMFACNAICYNHESPRRGESFVTRKIAIAAARIQAGLQQDLHLGNLMSQRDWGYAPDFVDGMWRMLQHDQPLDFVLATGVLSSVQDFLVACFEEAGLEWAKFVKVDHRLFRPVEDTPLFGDASLARVKLGWQAKTKMPELAKLMVRAEIDRFREQIKPQLPIA